MRRLIFIIILFIISVNYFTLTVFAENETSDFDQITMEINDELRDATDKDISQILDEEGISLDDTQSISQIKAESIFNRLWSYFTEGLRKPVAMLGRLIAVSIILSVIGSMSPDNGSMSTVFHTICILAIIVIMTDTLSNSFQALQNSLERMKDFMIAYIPIFSGVLTAGGNVLSAGGYTSMMLLICEILAFLSSNLLMPFLSSVLAVTLVTAINSGLKLSEIADSIKRLTIWILSVLMTILVGLISLQSTTAAATDSLGSKAVRFAASSFIPVIGNSVSEAYSAVKGSMGVIKAGVGSIGIIVVFLIAVKPIVDILAIKLTIWVGRLINELLGQREIAEFLKNANATLSIGLSIIIAYSIIFITATSIVVKSTLISGG